MSSYVQFVVCRITGNSKKYLFYAPAFSDIKEGDEVLVDMQSRGQRATVLAVCTTTSEDEKRALRVLAGAEDKLVKRVIGKYNFVKFDYKEDENNG